MKLFAGCTCLMVVVPAVFALEARTPFLGRNSSGLSGAAIPADLQVFAEDCHCSITGFCGCASALEFMSCVAKACKGQCNCEGGFHFLNACEELAATCPGTEFTCSAEESTCHDGSELMKVHIDGWQTYNAGISRIAVGSPVIATTTPADAVTSSVRVAIGDIWRRVVPKARAWVHVFAGLIVQNLLYIALVVVCAFIYNTRRATFWRKKTPAAPSDHFNHGLFDCCNGTRNRWLTLFVCCCWPLRWADTMDKARNLRTAPASGRWAPDADPKGLPSYWWGLVIMLGGLFISPLSAGLWGLFFCIYATFARHQFRQKLEMKDRGAVQVVGDFCSYCWCSCCAMVQEALEVEDRVALVARAKPK